jgi:dTDP-4-amino-4,6-dideoxygalactose transaminase
MVGSIPGLKVGDEIITTPWTMSATSSAILQNGAIPVFADISLEDFQLSRATILPLITPRTKAIMSVDIFGRSSDYRMLLEICSEYNLLLLSDSAQAPGAKFEDRYISQYPDMGGYSLNYHKHIHSGEGGFALTNNLDLASRMRLLRNHSESVVTDAVNDEIKGYLGSNFRLGEIEAAIAKPQVDRIDSIVGTRITAAHALISGLSRLPGVELPCPVSDQSNVFYILPIILTDLGKVSRDRLVEILRAEGIPGVVSNYTNIHRLPIFKQASNSWREIYPWNMADKSIALGTYGDGGCPVAEELFEFRFFGIHMCAADFTEVEVAKVIGAFNKVWSELGWIE